MPATAEPANAHVATTMTRIMMDILCLPLLTRDWHESVSDSLGNVVFGSLRATVNTFSLADSWWIDQILHKLKTGEQPFAQKLSDL
jgi:hypothetical protein